VSEDKETNEAGQEKEADEEQDKEAGDAQQKENEEAQEKEEKDADDAIGADDGKIGTKEEEEGKG